MSVPVFDLNSAILSSIGLTLVLVLVLLVVAAYQQLAPVTYWLRGLGLFACGLGIYFVPQLWFGQQHQDVVAAMAVTMVALAMTMFVDGIRLLRGYRVYRYRSLLVITTLLASNAVLLNLHSEARWVIVSNLVVLMWVFSYGSRSLQGHGRDFVAQLYWLCCGLFAGIGVMLAYMVLLVCLAPADQLQAFAHWPVHAYFTFCMMLVLTTVTCLLLVVMHVRAQAGLQAIATLDALTGVLNRRGLQEAAVRMQAVSQRLRLPLGMLIVDLDYFKKVNDVYGHLVGDVVIKNCAKTIRGALRGGDVIGRYGGEEFCILMPNTGEQEAMVLAERIRRIIETTPVSISGVESMASETQAIKCTVSVGAVSSETVGYDLEALFAAADQNLYKAKQDGRNRIVSNIEQVVSKKTAEPEPVIKKRHASLIA